MKIPNGFQARFSTVFNGFQKTGSLGTIPPPPPPMPPLPTAARQPASSSIFLFLPPHPSICPIILPNLEAPTQPPLWVAPAIARRIANTLGGAIFWGRGASRWIRLCSRRSSSWRRKQRALRRGPDLNTLRHIPCCDGMVIRDRVLREKSPLTSRARDACDRQSCDAGARMVVRAIPSGGQAPACWWRQPEKVCTGNSA